MKSRPHEELTASNTGSAEAADAAVANTGIWFGDYNQGQLARSGYLEKIRQIAPDYLFDRNAELAALAEFCLSPEAAPYAWWRGPANAGMSALMSTFVLHPPDGARIFAFFAAAPAQSNHIAFSDVLLEQLAEFLEEGMPQHLTEATRESHILQLLRRAGEECQRRGERLILVIDGLDKDPGVLTGRSIAGLLPVRPVANTRIVVTSRPASPIPSDVPSGHPLRDPGIVRYLVRSPHARTSPVARARPEPPYYATLREIRKRTPELHHREQEIAEFAGFAAGQESYRWLVGGAWAGKTALLAEAVAVGAPPQVDVVAYFASRREADADSNRFLAAVVPQLAYLLDEDPPDPDLHQFRAIWERVARWEVATDRHLLLVVDGLDEDLRPRGLPSIASILPMQSPGRTHVLVSSRPHPELPSDCSVAHPLRSVTPIELAPSSEARHLAYLARQEMDQLLHGDDEDLATDVLGLLTAAAGPLAIDDLATLTNNLAPVIPGWARRIHRFVTEEAARSLQPVGLDWLSVGPPRYQFAHLSLLERALFDEDLSFLRDRSYRERIHRWATQWRNEDWPIPAGRDGTTPLYLLDEYPSTLVSEPQQLASLAEDLGWIVAALVATGVDRVVAVLRTGEAAGALTDSASSILETINMQAYNLRSEQGSEGAAYILRQLCIQAGELGNAVLAEQALTRLKSLPGPNLVPIWTTRRASRNLSMELGQHAAGVSGLTVLANGGIVTSGYDGYVLCWDPAESGRGASKLGLHHSGAVDVVVLANGEIVSAGGNGELLAWDRVNPSNGAVELGRHNGGAVVMAVLPTGQIVSGGDDTRVCLWNPSMPGGEAVELGRHEHWVLAVSVFHNGRIVTAGKDGRLLVWDLAVLGAPPVELGRLDAAVSAVATLPDGRVVSGDSDGRLLMWDPAAPGTRPVQVGTPGTTVGAIAIFQDGRIVTGGDDGRLLVWDLAVLGAPRAELGRLDAGVSAVAILPDGRVVSGGLDGKLLIWNSSVLRHVPVERDRFCYWVSKLAVLSDGRILFVDEDGLRILDASARRVAAPSIPRYFMVHSVAVMPDDRIVVGGSRDLLIVNPDRPDEDPIKVGSIGTGSWGMIVVVLPDGRIITGGQRAERIKMWDPTTPGAPPIEFSPNDREVKAMAALSDGRIITCGDGRLQLRDPSHPEGDPVEVGEHSGAVAVAPFPEGRFITAGHDGRVCLWDPAAQDGDPIVVGSHWHGVIAVAVLPSGLVISGGRDGRVRIWDAGQSVEVACVSCSVAVIGVSTNAVSDERVVLAHKGQGISMWSVIDR